MFSVDVVMGLVAAVVALHFVGKFACLLQGGVRLLFFFAPNSAADP